MPETLYIVKVPSDRKIGEVTVKITPDKATAENVADRFGGRVVERKVN